MRFYRITYNANKRIERRINEDGDRFESIFEAMPDEIFESSSGNVKAFISDYSSKKMHISASVETGDINDYLDEINSYFPPYISHKAIIEEITCEHFNDILEKAERINAFVARDMLEEIGIDKICKRFGPEGLYSENFIKNTSVKYISRSLDDELFRINKTGKPVIDYNPVHYIIGGNSKESRKNISHILLSELHRNYRISQVRYTVIHIVGSHHGNILEIADELNAYFEISRGGAIVFSIEDEIANQDEHRSYIYELLNGLSETVKKCKNSSLCIFLLPDNRNNSISEIHKIFSDIPFVDITEGNLDYEHSRRYLSESAKNKNIRADKFLYTEIEKDGSYFLDELDNIFDDWFRKTIISKSFPAYSEYYEKQAVKRIKEKEEMPEGDAYDELMSMTGLDEAKKVINEAVDFFKAQKIFADSGFTQTRTSMHMVFTGSPGTAKTTVARLFARIMRDNDILSEGRFVEVGRADLIGKYVGWTAQIVKEKFRKANGGVLFIDEAYSLVDDRNGSYGDEAINTIVQEMENNRSDVIVIFAGYSDKMEEFLRKNPGLRSRIAFHVPFDDYSPPELVEIAKLMAEKEELTLDDGVKEKLLPIMEAASKQDDFGNGRFVRNLMEKARMKQAVRLIHSKKKLITREQVSTLIPDDFEMPIINSANNTSGRIIGF